MWHPIAIWARNTAILGWNIHHVLMNMESGPTGLGTLVTPLTPRTFTVDRAQVRIARAAIVGIASRVITRHATVGCSCCDLEVLELLPTATGQRTSLPFTPLAFAIAWAVLGVATHCRLIASRRDTLRTAKVSFGCHHEGLVLHTSAARLVALAVLTPRSLAVNGARIHVNALVNVICTVIVSACCTTVLSFHRDREFASACAGASASCRARAPRLPFTLAVHRALLRAAIPRRRLTVVVRAFNATESRLRLDHERARVKATTATHAASKVPIRPGSNAVHRAVHVGVARLRVTLASGVRTLLTTVRGHLRHTERPLASAVGTATVTARAPAVPLTNAVHRARLSLAVLRCHSAVGARARLSAKFGSNRHAIRLRLHSTAASGTARAPAVPRTFTVHRALLSLARHCRRLALLRRAIHATTLRRTCFSEGARQHATTTALSAHHRPA